MRLSRKKFNVSETIATGNAALTKTDLKNLMGYDFGTIGRITNELAEAGLTIDGTITNLGLNAMKSYRENKQC